MTNAILEGLRADLQEIFRAALAAVDPTRLVAEALVRRGNEVVVEAASARWSRPTLVIGAGKAAARMAAGCENALGVRSLRGEVIVADGCAVDLRAITVKEAGHPLPDARGYRATQRLIELIRTARAGGILCLISGGASSLLVHPRPPVRLEEKIRTTQLLLECGADINELNTVRKHLSLVKGGGLLRETARPVVSLLISDVVGDNPSTIGSGPTAPDPTTFAQAWEVLERYRLAERVPASVARLLQSGAVGAIPETVKPGAPEIKRSHSVIVGSNRCALEGAARHARARGWDVAIEAQPLTGDTTEAAHRFAARAHQLGRSRPVGRGLCILAGGETTVRVTGRGRGGRNQEFALALASDIAGETIAVLSAGTDGIDGPTDAAGAFVDGTSATRAHRQGLSPEAALADNDSYGFFARLGDLLRCGPTGTNVMDIKVALLPAAGLPSST